MAIIENVHCIIVWTEIEAILPPSRSCCPVSSKHQAYSLCVIGLTEGFNALAVNIFPSLWISDRNRSKRIAVSPLPGKFTTKRPRGIKVNRLLTRSYRFNIEIVIKTQSGKVNMTLSNT